MQLVWMRRLAICFALCLLSVEMGRAGVAYVIGNTTFVRIELLAQLMKANNSYFIEEKTYHYVVPGGSTFLIPLGSNAATQDGKPLKLEAKPMKIGQDVYVPTGVLCKAFGVTLVPVEKGGLLRLQYRDPGEPYGIFTLAPMKLTAEELALRQRAIPKERERAIFNAVAHNDAATVAKLMKAYPELRYAQDNYGFLPLHFAAQNGLYKMVEALLASGASLTDRNGGGETPLHTAANRLSYLPSIYGTHDIGTIDEPAAKATLTADKMVAWLIKKGADLNARSNEGGTPLHYACSVAMSADVARVLLDAGAQVDAINCLGETPLFQLPSSPKRMEILPLLEAKRADLNHRAFSGRTLLHYIVYRDTEGLPMMALLLERGMPVDVKDDAGATPFSVAVPTGCLKSAAFLLEKGADVNTINNAHLTPLMLALNVRRANTAKVLPIIDFLVKNGARVNAEKDGQLAPLHIACQNINVAAAQALIAAGANVNALDDTGKTPLQIAQASTKPEKDALIKVLLEAGAK